MFWDHKLKIYSKLFFGQVFTAKSAWATPPRGAETAKQR